MKKIFILAVTGALLSGCNDDDETFQVERRNDDYQPNTVGSTWTYSSFFDFTQTVTGGGKTIDGKKYFEYKITIEGLSSFKTYARKDGNTYINREIFSGQYDDGEYIFLKDAPEGTYWTELSYDEDGVETSDLLFIVETNETVTVGSETFNNVIIVEVSSLTEGNTEPYILYHYYAKGVGLIRIADDFGFANTDLASYSIKN
ncbi:hypothetical protein QQ054_16730 [Oscillatoria amoena NRMC-F 0135]|nr:hypothetical protein [Oscillatoria amoena NRMC-F 0135]